MIRKFSKIQGTGIESIPGQNRLAYALTRTEDFYDAAEWISREEYPGSQILFYDLEKGDVCAPFPQRANTVYGKPLFSCGALYFLQGDFNAGLITLLRYLPGHSPEAVKAFAVEKVDLYNLELIGDPVHVVSQTVGERFACYYPEQISFPLEDHEAALCMDAGKVFLGSWAEEGECDSLDYRYYEKVVIRDHQGRKISDETGCLEQMPDGSWWIS